MFTFTIPIFTQLIPSDYDNRYGIEGTKKITLEKREVLWVLMMWVNSLEILLVY